MKFVNLANPYETAGDVPETTMAAQGVRARQIFPILADSSPFHYWKPGKPIPNAGKRILIIVATFSLLELRMLDLLRQQLSQSASSIRVDLMDADDLPSCESADAIIPNMYCSAPTPMVGIWSDGTFQEGRFGDIATDHLLALCGIQTDAAELARNLRPPPRELFE